MTSTPLLDIRGSPRLRSTVVFPTWISTWAVALRHLPGRSRRTYVARCRKFSRDVLVHARVFSQIVEPDLRPVVAAHHGVILVPGEDVVMVSEREVGPRLGLSAFQHHGEILAIQGLRRFDPEETEYRRRDVVGGSVVVARRPRSLTFRMADQERDVRNLRPESGG